MILHTCSECFCWDECFPVNKTGYRRVQVKKCSYEDESTISKIFCHSEPTYESYTRKILNKQKYFWFFVTHVKVLTFWQWIMKPQNKSKILISSMFKCQHYNVWKHIYLIWHPNWIYGSPLSLSELFYRSPLINANICLGIHFHLRRFNEMYMSRYL